MRPLIVDASVVAAAFFREPDAAPARELLASDAELLAPDLLYAEVANVIWKRWTRGEIQENEAGELLQDLLWLPLRITPSSELIDAALPLAVRTGRTVYDCIYLALAIQCRGVLVSGDRRLVNALAGGPVGKHIAHLGERDY